MLVKSLLTEQEALKTKLGKQEQELSLMKEPLSRSTTMKKASERVRQTVS